MGWTSIHVPVEYKNGRHFINRKAVCDDIFTDKMVDFKNKKEIGKYEVLKSVVNGTTYYAAIKMTRFATETEPETSQVFAMVALTSCDIKEYFNFSYKDIDETCGPYKYQCPKYILDMLSPTDNEYANEWRKTCYENITHDKNSLGKLPTGTVIKYKRCDGKEITVYKHEAGYQFKRPFWMLIDNSGYVSAKYIPKDFEIIKK